MFRLTRMEVTLGCLVASMTLGAAMLDWFQPSHSLARMRTPELTALRLQEAIQPPNSGSNKTSPCDGIRFDPHPVGQIEGLDDFDMIIDREGHYALNENTQRKESPERTAGILRVGLLVPPGSTETTPEQSITAGKLVRILRESYGISERNVEKHKDLVFQPIPTSALGGLN